MLHQIGVGTLGPVFRTYEPERDRLVAVKAIRLDITPEQAQALADELADISERGLFHPSIVEPVAAGVEGSTAYRAEEYVAAESLDVTMRQSAHASVETVLLLVTQLAGAIDFARAAGVGHGSLHPRDIFVTPDEEARATGFGVADALERVGLRAPVRRPYTAPERIAGAAWATPADVFSLGAIAYELLTGRRPAGVGAHIGPLTAGTPNAWMDGVHAVLARAMDEDPAARHPTALAFASDLKAAAQADAPGHSSAAALLGSRAGRVAPPAATLASPPPVVLEGPAEPEESPAATALDASDETPEPSRAPADPDPFFLGVAEAAAAPDEEPARFRDVGDLVDVRALEDEEVVAEVAPTALYEPEDLVASDRLHAGGPEEDYTDRWRDEEPGEPAAGDDRPFASGYGAPADRSRSSEASGAYEALPPASRQEPRRRSWAVAAVLVAGLLAGLGGGYALWGRGAEPRTTNQGAGTAGTGPGDAAAAREWTDGGGASERPLPVPPAEATEEAEGGSPSAGALPAAEPEPDTGRPAARTAGTLAIRSTPSGAGVTVNGRWRGRTPLTLEDLPFATYQVRIVEPGFAPATRALALSADDPDGTVSVRLERQAPPQAAPRAAKPPAQAAPPAGAFTGSIYVDSRPRGARVSINGKPVGVTPLRIPEMRIGTHVVRMELPDHRIWSSTARVTAGEEARVTGSLEPIR